MKSAAEELVKFAKLYGVSTDELLYREESDETEGCGFARIFSELSDTDKKEIMNLMNFKKRYKKSLNG
jgi:hypothetical protein